MSVSETRRLELYETLIDRLGDKPAATLMDFLPPGGWENVATKDDLRLLGERLTGLRGEMETGFADVHSRIDALDRKIEAGLTGVHSRIDGLDSKIDIGLAGLRGEMETGHTGLQGKIDGLDSKIDIGLAGLRGEMETGHTGLQGKIDGLDSKIDGLDSKIDNSLTGLRGEFALAMARQTRTIVFTMVGIAITIWLALLLPIGAGG